MNASGTFQKPVSLNEAELFRAVFDAAAIGIAVVNPRGEPIRCNPALERMLGYSEEELRGMTFPQFTHPEDCDVDMESFRALIQGRCNSYRLEKRYIRKDGSLMWARLTVSTIPSESDSNPFVVAMVEDISLQREAQRALQESEQKFARAFNGNPNPIAITRRSDGRFIEVNSCFLEWFGLSIEAAKRKTTFDLNLWQSAEERETRLTQIRTGGRLNNFERTLRRVNGEERVLLLTVEPIVIAGEDCFLTISQDITEQKRAELALRQSEERLRRGLQAARTGTWEWHIDTNEVVWSEGTHAAFGLRPGQFGERFEDVMSMIDSEDRDAAEKDIRAAVVGPGNSYHSEFRVTWEDKTRHWLESRGEVQRGPDGKPQKMLGTVVDITDRKRTELALRSSEESLRATLENTPYVAIQWYDSSGMVLYWNGASEVVFGWKAHEVLNKRLHELIFTGAESERFLASLKHVEQTGIAQSPIEYRFQRRDGTTGVCVSTLFRIPATTGDCCFVCMDVDITDQKRAEQAVLEAKERELQARQEFARELIRSGDRERQRLASELHDGVGQNLSIIQNTCFLALNDASVTQPISDHLNVISRSVIGAINEVRTIVRNLRPVQIERYGLTEAIRTLVENVARSTGIQCDFRVEEVERSLPSDAEFHLYRIVQEALNNVVTHSKAKHAELRLERDINLIRLTVSDDGSGFEQAQTDSQHGFGLRNILERAEIIGGSAKIESSPKSGTRLIVELPIAAAMEDFQV